MRPVQYTNQSAERCVGLVDGAGEKLQAMAGIASVYDFTWRAIADGLTLNEAIARAPFADVLDYQAIIDERRLLAPVDRRTISFLDHRHQAASPGQPRRSRHHA